MMFWPVTMLCANGGTVGNLTNACNDYQACSQAGLNFDAVGNLTNACNNFQACYNAGFSGEFGGLNNCCNEFRECDYFQNNANFPPAYFLTESPTEAPTEETTNSTTKSPVKTRKTKNHPRAQRRISFDPQETWHHLHVHSLLMVTPFMM